MTLDIDKKKVEINILKINMKRDIKKKVGIKYIKVIINNNFLLYFIY